MRKKTIIKKIKKLQFYIKFNGVCYPIKFDSYTDYKDEMKYILNIQNVHPDIFDKWYECEFNNSEFNKILEITMNALPRKLRKVSTWVHPVYFGFLCYEDDDGNRVKYIIFVTLKIKLKKKGGKR